MIYLNKVNINFNLNKKGDKWYKNLTDFKTNIFLMNYKINYLISDQSPNLKINKLIQCVMISLLFIFIILQNQI